MKTVYNICAVILIQFLSIFIMFINSVESSIIESRSVFKCLNNLSSPNLSFDEGLSSLTNKIHVKSAINGQDVVSTRVTKSLMTKIITVKELFNCLTLEPKMKYFRDKELSGVKGISKILKPFDAMDVKMRSRSNDGKQLESLDPAFGAFYIQRKMWYIPLYFSVVFSIYMWALIIKSLSRHRVLFPPPAAPPPPPPPPPAGTVVGR